MKTIRQIKQLVENIAINNNRSENNGLIDIVRNNFIPLFQFNLDASSTDAAQAVFSKISENTQRKGRR